MKPVNQTALILLLVGILFIAQTRADTWFKLENSHFTMYTPVREKTARELFLELEGFRALVLNFVNIDIPPDTEKVKIVLFKNIGDFRKYSWSNDIAGYVIPTDKSAVIVQPARTWGLDSTNIIYHEFVHTLLRYYPRKLPSWYNEGLAELFGATKYSNGKFEVGIAPKDRLMSWVYGGKLASFDDIVADKYRTHRPGYYEDPYVQYWMLAHYLEFDSKERKKDLAFYLLLYNDGMDSLEAFRTAFKQSPDEFWRNELKRYIGRGRIHALRVEIRPELSDRTITFNEADTREVEGSLLLLRAYAANVALYRKDYRKGHELLNKLTSNLNPEYDKHLSIINNIVWLLSTNPDEQIRDGKEAVRMGELYIKGKTENIIYLDTLAAAYAEAGRFDEAVQLQTELVSRLEDNDDRYADFSERLKRYQSNKPWHSKEESPTL